MVATLVAGAARRICIMASTSFSLADGAVVSQIGRLQQHAESYEAECELSFHCDDHKYLRVFASHLQLQGKPQAKRPNLDAANSNAASASLLLAEFRHLGKAHALLTEAIQIRPKQARWYAIRAQIYRGLGRNQLAFYDLNASIRLEPRTWQYYCSRSICLRKLRRLAFQPRLAGQLAGLLATLRLMCIACTNQEPSLRHAIMQVF